MSFERIVELIRKSNMSEGIARVIKGSKLSRRARIVVEHILEHGFITTEDLEKTYGYRHPPRAARDVREAGIPLETYHVESSDGRQIAAYRFGNSANIQGNRLGGRRVFSKVFKERLYEISDGKCAICSGHFEPRYLQIDHRIPYEVSGESKVSKRNIKDYMLVCGSCNRAKSWSCEHCPNWLTEKLRRICLKCYWSNPAHYAHIALREIRRVDILWDENEMQTYEKLRREAQKSRYSIPAYVKKIIARHLED
jgi:hypothetical protein